MQAKCLQVVKTKKKSKEEGLRERIESVWCDSQNKIRFTQQINIKEQNEHCDENRTQQQLDKYRRQEFSSSMMCCCLSTHPQWKN